MKSLRDILHALLSRYFRISKVPESLAPIAAQPAAHTIVTQGDSLVLAAMLDSFALRSGLKGAEYCGRSSANLAPAARSAEHLHWVSIEDEKVVSEIFSHDASHLFSTLNIFRVRGPVKRNPSYSMSLLRQMALLIGCRFLLIIFGTPVSVAQSSSLSAKQLVRLIKLDYYRNLKLVRGTPFQSIDTQAEAILGGSEFEREIRIIASRMGKSERTVKQLARKEFYRMAANPRAPMYWISSPLLKFMMNRLFSEITTKGLEKLVAAVRDATVVLVPMHRSHLDYIVLSTTLYQSNLNPPVVAAGVNLSVWPFGFVIRSLGGYFVKRNARQDRIHALLLKRYVSYLVKRGHLQEFFIEGGRSRSGRMSQPRVGLLNTIVSAYTRGLRKDILFIPVSITYENVMEDEVYGDENTGRSKSRENILSLFRARDLFKKKYGEAIIKFDDAISLARTARDLLKSEAPREADTRSLVNFLAGKLTRSIRDQSDISLTGLAYTAIMLQPGYGMTRADLAGCVKNLARLALLAGTRLGGRAACTPGLQSFLGGNDSILDDLARGGVIKIQRCLDSDLFLIPGDKRFTADFYKNSCIHLLLPFSLFAITELLHDEIAVAALKPFHDALSFDFQLPPWEEFEHYCGEILGLLRIEGLLENEAGRMRFGSRAGGIFIPALLLPAFQTLLWINSNLQHCLDHGSDQAGDKKGGQLGSCNYAELLARLQSSFKAAMYAGLFTRTEAASQSALSSALESLKNRHIINIEEGPSHTRRVILLKSDESSGLIEAANVAIRRWQLDNLIGKTQINRNQNE